MCTLKREEIKTTCVNNFNKNYCNIINNNIIIKTSKTNFAEDNTKIITPSRRRTSKLKALNCFNSCKLFRSSFMCTTEKSPSKMANTITNVIRNVVSKQRKRYVANGYDLDLSYICDNIIAMGYPAANIEKWYRNHIDDVVKFLEENHKDHYKIYNLCSERNYDISTFHGRVAVFPFADHNPPTIELMQKFCDDINNWLKSDKDNVAAVHCKAGKGRTGTMICCYLLQCGFARTADEALSYYDEKRTKDKKGVTIPSQRRYVEYYAKLLTSGKIYERRTLQICEIKFSSPPLSSSQGTVLSLSTLYDPSCPDKVKTLQNFSIDFRKSSNVEITDRCIPVTGDVRIELTQKVTKKTLLHLWFNVYFIDQEGERHGNGDDLKIIYEFKKSEIDDAHKDKENKAFAEDFSVQLVFQTIPSRNNCGDKKDNLAMSTSLNSNYEHNHCGNMYNNAAFGGINYMGNVESSQHEQMDIQPIIEPLKQQNHNNSNISLNNSNLTIRQQQQQTQQDQYAFPMNQNQFKHQLQHTSVSHRNMNSVGPINLNSKINSPTVSTTQNNSNNSTSSVKNKNLSLDLTSSLVISPHKNQHQHQTQEHLSQTHQVLHEKQQHDQNTKNNLKNPEKISSNQHSNQQLLEQPSSNKIMVISSNQNHPQQQQPHESRTNSTSSNTSKSSSNSSSSISISSAASSSACIGEDWESENQQNILPIEGKVKNSNNTLNTNKSVIDSSSSYNSSLSNKSSLENNNNNNYYTISSTAVAVQRQSSIGLAKDSNQRNLNITNLNDTIIDDSDSDDVFIRSSSFVVNKNSTTFINRTSIKQNQTIKIEKDPENIQKNQIENENAHESENEEHEFVKNYTINEIIENDDVLKLNQNQKIESQQDNFQEKQEKSQSSNTSSYLQRRFSRNFPSVTNTSLGMKAIILKNLKINYRRGST